MKFVVVSTVLLILAIAQTQAFFTLFEEEMRQGHGRRGGRSEVMEEEPVESNETAEASEQQEVEPTEAVGVTQEDINLLRRDIKTSIDRLRRTIELYMFRMTYPYHSLYRHTLGKDRLPMYPTRQQ